MAHSCQELALGSIGRIGFFPEPLNFFFRLFALGDISAGGIDQSLFREGRRVPLHHLPCRQGTAEGGGHRRVN